MKAPYFEQLAVEGPTKQSGYMGSMMSHHPKYLLLAWCYFSWPICHFSSIIIKWCISSHYRERDHGVLWFKSMIARNSCLIQLVPPHCTVTSTLWRYFQLNLHLVIYMDALMWFARGDWSTWNSFFVNVKIKVSVSTVSYINSVIAQFFVCLFFLHPGVIIQPQK